MHEFSFEYKDGKLTAIVNGQELQGLRHIEIMLPVYADPFIKIGQLVTPPGPIEQSIITVITDIGKVNINGELKDD